MENRELFKRTSRNFYHASMLLPTNLRKINTVLYLTARIADTIEDCGLSIDAKKEYFHELRKILKSGEIERLDKYQNSAFFSEKDHDLLINSEGIINGLHSLEKPVSEIIIENVIKMTIGMEKYLEKRIMTFDDQDEYCDYVAGTVGDALTRTYSHLGALNHKGQYEKMIQCSRDFALALQKTNIIRGIRSDYNENKNNKEANKIYAPESLLRSRGIKLEDLFNKKFMNESLGVLDELKSNNLRHFDNSLCYLFSIPYAETGIRKFSYAIFFSSLMMLKKMDKNYEVFSNSEEIGLSKTESMKIFLKTHINSANNSKIERDYRNLRDLMK